MPDRPDYFADDSRGRRVPANGCERDGGTFARRAEPAQHGEERGGSRSTERGFIPLSARKYCYLLDGGGGGRGAATQRAATRTARISRSNTKSTSAFSGGTDRESSSGLIFLVRQTVT